MDTTLDEAATPPAGSKRRANALARRRHILWTARELFEENGFEGTTTDDIAAAANITKRTLYRYMGSKEQLLYELHEDFIQGLLREVNALQGSPTEKFRAMVLAHLRDLGEHRRDIKVFFDEIKHVDDTKRANLVESRQVYEDAVSEILQEGVDEGTFAIDDVGLVTRAILGALNDGYRWFDPDGPHTVEELADLFTDMMLSGLASSAGSNDSFVIPAALDLPPRDDASATPADRIASAAARLFSRNGYRATKTQEIADDADVTKGALFYHVSSKDEILMMILRGQLERYLLVLDTTTALNLSATDTLICFLVGQARDIARDRDSVAVLVEEIKYLPEPMAKEIEDMATKAYGYFERCLVDGAASGEFRAFDPRLAVLFITGMLTFTYRWYDPRDKLSPDDLGRTLADLVLTGIVAR